MLRLKAIAPRSPDHQSRNCDGSCRGWRNYDDKSKQKLKAIHSQRGPDHQSRNCNGPCGGGRKCENENRQKLKTIRSPRSPDHQSRNCNGSCRGGRNVMIRISKGGKPFVPHAALTTGAVTAMVHAQEKL